MEYLLLLQARHIKLSLTTLGFTTSEKIKQSLAGGTSQKLTFSEGSLEVWFVYLSSQSYGEDIRAEIRKGFSPSKKANS